MRAVIPLVIASLNYEIYQDLLKIEVFFDDVIPTEDDVISFSNSSDP